MTTSPRMGTSPIPAASIVLRGNKSARIQRSEELSILELHLMNEECGLEKHASSAMEKNLGMTACTNHISLLGLLDDEVVTEEDVRNITSERDETLRRMGNML
jgi:hypothetical protein